MCSIGQTITAKLWDATIWAIFVFSKIHVKHKSLLYKREKSPIWLISRNWAPCSSHPTLSIGRVLPTTVKTPLPFFTPLHPLLFRIFQTENVDAETIWVLNYYTSTKQCNFTSSECFERAEGGTPRVSERSVAVCWLTEEQNKLWIMGGGKTLIEYLEVSNENSVWNNLGQSYLFDAGSSWGRALSVVKCNCAPPHLIVGER